MKSVSGILLCALVSLFCSNSLLAQSVSTPPPESVHYTNELHIDPARVDEFYTFIQEAAKDTRAFDGCQYFAILVDNIDPGRVVFYEIWDSMEHHQAYRAWRNEMGFGELIGPYLMGATESHYYSKLDD